ncbi:MULTISPECIES: hypothetical protein [unclassified Flavobacterium]|nr:MULTISPECIES: hypothetical protein [unclassified Flavobacterium]
MELAPLGISGIHFGTLPKLIKCNPLDKVAISCSKNKMEKGNCF